MLCVYSARRGVEQAKKKVRQQAKQIRELQEKLQNNGLEQQTRKTNHVTGSFNEKAMNFILPSSS